MIRLYDLERDQGIKIFLPAPAEISDGSKYIVFGHIDGMYSYCETEKGGVIHLNCSTPLKKVEGGYEVLTIEPDETSTGESDTQSST